MYPNSGNSSNNSYYARAPQYSQSNNLTIPPVTGYKNPVTEKNWMGESKINFFNKEILFLITQGAIGFVGILFFLLSFLKIKNIELMIIGRTGVSVDYTIYNFSTLGAIAAAFSLVVTFLAVLSFVVKTRKQIIVQAGLSLTAIVFIIMMPISGFNNLGNSFFDSESYQRIDRYNIVYILLILLMVLQLMLVMVAFSLFLWKKEWNSEISIAAKVNNNANGKEANLFHSNYGLSETPAAAHNIAPFGYSFSSQQRNFANEYINTTNNFPNSTAEVRFTEAPGPVPQSAPIDNTETNISSDKHNFNSPPTVSSSTEARLNYSDTISDNHNDNAADIASQIPSSDEENEK